MDAVALDGVAWAALDGPEGALDPEGARRLVHRIRSAEDDPANRLIVLHSSYPSVFCSGMDVERLDPGTRIAEHVGTLFDLLDALRSSPLLVVCAVDGWASGAGVGLIAAADVVLATRRSRLGLPEVVWGIVPWSVGPFLLRRMNAGAVQRLACTGLAASADEACRVGLVDRVVDDLDLDVTTLARRMALIPRPALAATKAYTGTLAPEPCRATVIAAASRHEEGNP